MVDVKKTIILLTFLRLCVSTPSAAEPVQADVQTAPLLVRAAWPCDSSGEIELPEYLQITFSSPVVALTSPSDQPLVSGIGIDPPAPGEWRWIGTDAVEFRPLTAFQVNTEYTVSLPKGFPVEAAGKSLREPYSWKFRTKRFHFESSTDSNEFGLTKKTPLYLQFNQGIDLNDCRKALAIVPFLRYKLTYADSAECRNRFGAIGRQDGSDGSPRDRIVKIIPTDGWVRATAYLITLRKEMKPRTGNLRFEKDTVIVKRTVGDLAFKSMEQYADDWRPLDFIAQPENPLSFRFTNHVDWKKQRCYVKIAPNNASDSTEYSGPDTRFRIDKGLRPGTKYCVTFDRRLTDIFGNRLGVPVVKRFATGSSAPFSRMLSDDRHVESLGHRSIPVYYCNKKSIELDLISLPIDAAIGWRRSPDAFEALLDRANNERWPVCRIRGVPDTARNRCHLWKLPLDTILHGASGFVAARLITRPDTGSQGKKSRFPSDTTLGGYMVSNIGLTIQEGNGEYRFYATHLDNGLPLPGAAITVHDGAGTVLWSSFTGSEGQARLSSGSDFRTKLHAPRQSTLQVAVAHDREWIVKRLCAGDFVGPREKRLPVFAAAFTDRGLYLPGDTVRFTAILRADDDSLMIPRHCRAQVISSYRHRDRTCDTVAVSQGGLVSYALPIPRDAEFGSYAVSGKLLEYDTLRKTHYEDKPFSASFIIGEFRANSIECAVQASRDTFYTGDTVVMQVSARYLYDAPYAHASGRITPMKKPYSFSSELFKGYSFDAGTWEGNRLQCKFDTGFTCTLDGSGKRDFRIPLHDTLFRGAYVYDIFCDLSSAHDNVSGSKRIIVHPGEYYIGLKPHAWYGAVGEAQTFDVAAVTVSGKPVAVKNLAATIVLRKSRPIETDDDARDAQERAGGPAVWSGKISTDASGAGSFTFRPLQAGDYSVTVGGIPRRISSSLRYTVFKKKYAWSGGESGLSLKTHKQAYEVGDTVRLLLSPLLRKGKALVTTERDHVFTDRWVDIAPDNPEIKIPVLPVYRSGFWISVAAYYGGKTSAAAAANQDTLRGPQWARSSVFVEVGWREKNLPITLKPDKTVYAPGEEVSLECAVPSLRQSAHEVIVWAEDEGVLSLTGYKTPDILDDMYSHREHGVSISDTRESLIKRFGPYSDERFRFVKGGALGGAHGTGNVLAGGFSEDAKARKRFSMCPLFASYVQSDTLGRKNIRFRLPDNLTRFRIMAVAATDDGRFGNADTSIIVTKPIFVRPIIPQFLRNCDTVRIGALIENRTDSALAAAVSFSGTGIDFFQSASGSVTVEPRNRKEFSLQAVVDSSADTVRMLLQAVSRRDSDVVAASVPVSPFRFPEAVTSGGIVDKNTSEKIARPHHHDLNRSTLSIEATNTIVQDLKGGLDYLKTYPYDCAEQMTSRILPYLLCGNLLRRDSKNSLTDSVIHEKVAAYLDALPHYWGWNGFSYWKGGVGGSPYVTAYILFTLYRAIDCGYDVRSEIMDDCLNVLFHYLQNPNSKKEHDWYSLQCYVAGVLSEYDTHRSLPPEASRIVDSLINALAAQHARGSLFAQVNLLRALRKNGGDPGLRRELAEHIRAGVVHEPLYAYFDEPATSASRRWHQTPVRTTALILQTFLETGEDLPGSDKIVRWLLLQKSRQGHWGTTQNNLYALWALSTYARIKEPPAASCRVKIFLDDDPIVKFAFDGRTPGERVEWQKTFSAIPSLQEHSVLFKISGTGPCYYTIHLNSLPLQPVAPFDAGFLIEKSYAALDGRPVSLDSLRYREIVLVKTTVSTPRQRQYVVFDDPIPAGCEIVNEAFNTVEQAVKDGIRSKNKDFYFSWSTWNHYEYRKEGCRVFATRLRSGEHRFTYAIRPIARGTFHLPPAHVEEMYSPEVYGTTGERLATVR